MSFRKAAPHKAQRWTALAILVSAGLLVASVTSVLATVSGDAGFEGSDGNLAPNAGTPNFDWNSFATVEWPNTAPNAAPYRDSTPKTVAGWDFLGFEDAQEDGNDTAFAGGTKQDDNCATVKLGPKAPNKDDLERIYVTTNTVGGELYLGLAWVRIPQNTTSASAHVAFEFNQNDGGCPNTTIPGNDGLSSRSTANGGDMLIVYDFEGSSTDTPTLKLLRWQSTGDCEATGKPAATTGPCWVFQQDLTAAGNAEAKVNTSDVGSVTDLLTPPTAPATTSVSESLGDNEFGEAIINLTDAGVIDPTNPTSCVGFGRVFGVSRSSGNSAQAQMKDLVGPGDVNISNCGTVIIRKQTIPDGDTTTSFGFTTDVVTLPASTTSPFSLMDDGVNTILNVPGDTYFVTEGDPSGDGYLLTDIDCSASDTAVTPTESEGTLTASFTLAPDETVDCTFTNTFQSGAIKVTKTAKNAGVEGGVAPLAGAGFEIWEESNGLAGLQTSPTPDPPDPAIPADTFVAGPLATVLNGTGDEASACFDGLALATYYVRESSPPTGYAGEAPKNVTVDNTAECEDDPYTGESVAFVNAPLSEIRVIFQSLAGTGITVSSIVCSDGGGAIDPVSENFDPDPALDDTDETYTNLMEGTYTCTIVIDP